MRPTITLVAVGAVFAYIATSSDAKVSNVKIAEFEQAGLELSFRVTWDTETEGVSAGSDLVDIWLLSRQPNPSSWMETALEEGVENVGSLWVDAGDAWANRGGWDNAISGEATVCVYNGSDYLDSACGEALPVLPTAEAPYAPPGDGISNVNVPRVEVEGDSLSFSVTWADGGGSGGTEDTASRVDIWLSAKQYDPDAWVEIPVLEDVENNRIAHVDLEVDWSPMGWDATHEGEISICIYDSANYSNSGCSDFSPFADSKDGFAGTDQAGDAEGEGEAEGESSSSSSSSSGTGGGGTVLAFVIAGGLVGSLGVWLAVGASRRRQRRKWVGAPEDAEELPDEDVFMHPNSLAYSAF